MTHICPECGFEHAIELAEAVEEAPVVAETEAAVAIAEIQADRDVQLAKIAAKAEETDDQRRIAGLEGEMRGMRDMLEKLMPTPEPEPDPVPVVVQAAPDPVAEEPGITPPPIVEPAPTKSKRSSAWW